MTKPNQELLDRMAYDMTMDKWVAEHDAKPTVDNAQAFAELLSETVELVKKATDKPFVGWAGAV